MTKIDNLIDRALIDWIDEHPEALHTYDVKRQMFNFANYVIVKRRIGEIYERLRAVHEIDTPLALKLTKLAQAQMEKDAADEF
jgi:hypothetical protein